VSGSTYWDRRPALGTPTCARAGRRSPGWFRAPSGMSCTHTIASISHSGRRWPGAGSATSVSVEQRSGRATDRRARLHNRRLSLRRGHAPGPVDEALLGEAGYRARQPNALRRPGHSPSVGPPEPCRNPWTSRTRDWTAAAHRPGMRMSAGHPNRADRPLADAAPEHQETAFDRRRLLRPHDLHDPRQAIPQASGRTRIRWPCSRSSGCRTLSSPAVFRLR
jgi:hypothetical protein